MRTFSDNEKSRPRPARWSWLPWAALCCLWCGFGERRGVRGKRTAQNFAFSEFWPFLHLFHVILKNFYIFLSILIFSVCFIRIFEKYAKTPHFRAAFLLCIFFINTSWWRLLDSNQWPHACEYSIEKATASFTLHSDLSHPDFFCRGSDCGSECERGPDSCWIDTWIVLFSLSQTNSLINILPRNLAPHIFHPSGKQKISCWTANNRLAHRNFKYTRTSDAPFHSDRGNVFIKRHNILAKTKILL